MNELQKKEDNAVEIKTVTDAIDNIIKCTNKELVKNIDVYLLAQLRNELVRISKYNDLLESLEEKFYNKIMLEGDEYPISVLQAAMEYLTTSLDRSDRIIAKITNTNPVVSDKVSVNNTTINIGSTNLSDSIALATPQVRDKVRAAISRITTEILPITQEADAPTYTIVNADTDL